MPDTAHWVALIENNVSEPPVLQELEQRVSVDHDLPENDRQALLDRVDLYLRDLEGAEGP